MYVCGLQPSKHVLHYYLTHWWMESERAGIAIVPVVLLALSFLGKISGSYLCMGDSKEMHSGAALE